MIGVMVPSALADSDYSKIKVDNASTNILQFENYDLLRTTFTVENNDVVKFETFYVYIVSNDDAHYESENYTVRGTQQYEKFGFGFDYKHNESLSGQHHNLGYFYNVSYNIFSYHHRFDEEHETYKLGFFKELEDGLSISGSTSTSYKDKTTWTAIEYGESQELTLTKNNFSTTIFLLPN